MKTVGEYIETVSDQEIERKIERAWERRRSDMASKYDFARTQGFEQAFKEAFKEGFIEGIIMVTENMLKYGVDIEMIIKVTGLSLDKIKEIENRLK